MGRPEAPLTGFGGSGGGFPGLTLDSYAAPISGGSNSGPYPSGGPPPQYGPPQQAPVIHKHVYVHVPPPEPTYYAPKKPVQPPPPPQKHYKIVFIKAPTPPPPTVPDIPAIAPPAEQKTLIYVLVKKPDEAPEIHIPTPAPTQPSKPEVYFIRYKTQVIIDSCRCRYCCCSGVARRFSHFSTLNNFTTTIFTFLFAFSETRRIPQLSGVRVRTACESISIDPIGHVRFPLTVHRIWCAQWSRVTVLTRKKTFTITRPRHDNTIRYPHGITKWSKNEND